MLSKEARERPDAQNVANFVYSLAILPSAQPSTQLLDALCAYFLKLLQSSAVEEQPNFAWALQELKCVPSPGLAATMLSRMLNLCQIAGQQPNSQTISKFLLASAELRLALPQRHADALASHLLGQSNLLVQESANIAWSLAVSGALQLDTFRQLLQRLHAQPGCFDHITQGKLRQLYLALDWLAPPSNASTHHHKAWSELQAALRHLGSRPQLRPHSNALRC